MLEGKVSQHSHPRNNVPEALERELLHLAKEEEKILARDKYLRFILYTMPEYMINWHNAVLAKYLDAFVNKQILRLIICIGTRMGKTQQVSRHLPPYIFGKNPDARIIAVSHTSTRAQRVNRDVQRLIMSNRYQELFPKTRLQSQGIRKKRRDLHDDTKQRTSTIFDILGGIGQYLCAGVDGSVVGEGADYILVDDPMKGIKEAYSEVARQKVIDYYQSDLFPRLDASNGSVLITHTRWHQNDLVGFLLDLQNNNSKMKPFVVLNFPQIRTLDAQTVPEDPREPGSDEVLWPAKFSKEFMEELQAVMAPRMWAAQQMGSPIVEGGNIFKRDWFRYYDCDPVGRIYTCYREGGLAPLIISFDDIVWISYTDPSVEKKDTSDPMGMLAIGYSERHKVWLICDAFQEKELIINQDRVIRKFSFKNKALVAQVENEKAGKFLSQQSDKYNEGVDGILAHDAIPYELCPTEGLSKETRAVQMAIHMEAGRVYSLRGAPWLLVFEDQLLSFPYGKHDHLVDCLSMARFREPEGMSPAEAMLQKMNM